jgi:hypothetical protein
MAAPPPWDESYGDCKMSIIDDHMLACRTPLDPGRYRADGWTVHAMLAKAMDMVATSAPRQRKFTVINLSATAKYYSTNPLGGYAPYDVEFHHISLRGHTVPSQTDTDNFLIIADDAIARRRVVIVHCTHGLNRTGFMVCRWLMRAKGWTAAQALEYFSFMRAPGIMRDNIKTSV